jgi:phosphatidylserine/phosphatidylglycerophosphate/cardiolipin synthase-like enzyme
MRALVVLLLLLAPFTASAQTPRVQEPEQARPWAVYFSPDEAGATRAVVEALARAKETVRVHAVLLRSPEITRALIDAHERRVSVEVILDGKRSARAVPADTLIGAGITTLNDATHRAPTTNVVVIDNQVVITGTVGFAPSSQGSLLVIHDPTLARRYTEDWERHAAHSQRHTANP